MARNDRLHDFEVRLNRLKEANSTKAGTADGKQSGYGMAFTIAADLVGGLIGGAGIGWLIDRWLGSAPFGLIAFFFLGAAAGMWNVYRTVRGYDMSLGFHQSAPGEPVPEGKTATPAGARLDKEGGDHRGQSTPSVRSAADHPDPHRER
jgi:ATP synthase protein I